MALYTRATGTTTTQYLLLDHLGSVAEITNSAGTLDVPENFAAFGERRDASDWSGPPSAADKTAIAGITQRGYTFHTNSEESSLIHMNGRIADSLTGRFLSADPYVPNPGLTQSFNRYSYVRNNPLTYTDPSGFYDPWVTGSVVGTLWSFGKKLFGKKKRPPPPGCKMTATATGCYGKAVATKLYEIARDIYGLPPLQSSSIWGVGDGTFGSGPCGWGPGCMSWGEGDVANEVLNDEQIAQASEWLKQAQNAIDLIWKRGTPPKPRQSEFTVTSAVISPTADPRDRPGRTRLGGTVPERYEPRRYSPSHAYARITIYPAGAETFKDVFETYAHEMAHFEYYPDWQAD